MLPARRQEHGSHVAGIAAAVGNNSFGVTGMAWQAGLLVCRVFNASEDGAYLSAILRCAQHCVEASQGQGGRRWVGACLAFSPLVQLSSRGPCKQGSNRGSRRTRWAGGAEESVHWPQRWLT